MTSHDWNLTLRATHVTGICVDCGATTRGGVHVGSLPLPTGCPGKVETTHSWTIGADEDTAFAACSWCGVIRTSSIADGVGGSFGAPYSPHLDLSGDCAAVAVTA